MPGSVELADGEVDYDAHWYVLVDQQQFGPVKFKALAILAGRGQLRRSDLVWTAGFDSWVPAGTVPSLFPPLPAEPPPPPPNKQISSPLNAREGDRVWAGVAAQRVETRREARSRASDGGPRNYFVRHWLGQLSLPVSYWVNGVLLNLIAAAVIVAIAASTSFKDDFNPGIALVSTVLIWAVIFAGTVWQLVGIWRSAGRYGRVHPRKYWGAVAKVVVVLGVIRTVAEFGQGGVPQIVEYYNIYSGDGALGKYGFRVLRDGQELEFSGGITFGAAKELDRFLNAMGALKVVHLNSEGGRILEAQKMGDLIRRRGLSTYVSKQCLSACTIIFLNGRERLISADARIGFHQPDFPGLKEQDRQTVIAAEVQRLRHLGVSEAFARRANQALPSGMWYPSVTELLTEKVATRLVSSSELALSGFSQSEMSSERIQAVLLENPIYAALRKINPDAYAKVHEKFENGLRRGISLAELRAEVFPIGFAVVQEVLPHSSQALLLEFGKFMVTAATNLGRQNPSDCYAYFNPDRASASALLEIREKYKSVSAAEDDLMARILTSYSGKVRLPTEREVSASLEKVQAALKVRYGETLSVLDEADLPPSKHGTYCSILASLYEQVLRLPPSDATALLRHFFATK